MPMETAIDASAAEISSSASRYVSVSSPMPSYSSGVQMPRKPSLPSSSITSRGKWLVRSHSAANGSIFSRANSRASSTTWRCVSVNGSVTIDIKPHARFSSQPSRRHHLLEQPRRPVLGIAKSFDHDFQNSEADVETDQIGERKRPARMLHAEGHHLIHGFGRRDALLHAQNRLVDHGHQHPLRHEPPRLIDHHRSLPQLLRNLHDSRDRPVPRLLSPHYLHERHERHRIHEVHADNPARSVGVLG